MDGTNVTITIIALHIFSSMLSRSHGEETKVTDVDVTVKYVESDAATGDNTCESPERPRKLRMQVRLDDPVSLTSCPSSPVTTKLPVPGLIRIQLDLLSPYSIAANVLEQRFFPAAETAACHQPQKVGQRQQKQQHKPTANHNKRMNPATTSEPVRKDALKILKQVRKKKRPSEVLREVRAVTQEVINFRKDVREATLKHREKRLQSSLEVSN